MLLRRLYPKLNDENVRGEAHAVSSAPPGLTGPCRGKCRPCPSAFSSFWGASYRFRNWPSGPWVKDIASVRFSRLAYEAYALKFCYCNSWQSAVL